ncbi:MAG TPA: sugar ABC transporter substrate-binding protein [Burkholderiales bacterium]|nr:sugar ABC transporter substrate-binding protein [Burkholderiales bacterium]
MMLRWLLGALLVLLSGCVPSPSDRQTIRFWVMGREGEVVARLLPEFERRNPDIRVRVQQLPWTAAHEKLLTAYAGDSLPDLCQLGNTWVPEFAALRALAELKPEVAASRVIAAEDYFPGIWSTNVIDGRLYGIPWYVDTRLLFYRRDLVRDAGFDAPPRSWEEWERVMAAVKENAGPAGYAILLPLNEFEPLLALALQQDEPLLRDDATRGAFASPGFRRALDFYARMFRNDWAPTMAGAQISNVWAEFERGLFAFYISGPWNIEEFKRRLRPEHQRDWMTAPLPGPKGPGASTAGGASLVVFRSARHPQAAWRLIEYLSEPAVQVQFHQLTGNLPPRRTAWRDRRLADNEYAWAFREQLERVRPAPKVPEWERIVGEMQMTAEQVVRGRVGIDQATQALDRRVDAMLEKRRWLLARGKSQ